MDTDAAPISKCRGGCLQHRGLVRRVKVTGADKHDWGTFWYCETAIQVDESHGFTIQLVGPDKGEDDGDE